MVEHRLDETLLLVGDEAKQDAIAVQGIERRAHARHQRRQPGQMLCVDVEHHRLLVLERLRSEWVAGRHDRALDQLLDAIADHRRDGGKRKRPASAAGQKLVDRGSDIGRRIDQRAVKVEQDGAWPARRRRR